MLRRVDAEAVDLEARDPRREDLRESLLDIRLLREEIVEPEEVALLEARLAARAEVDVAAVVVVERVVQPLGLFPVTVAWEHERDVRHVGGLQARELPGDISGRAEGLAVAVAERDVAVRRAGQLDDVSRVVHDDVEVDLHAEAVCGCDEVREVLVSAEMRVDRREVEAPVAVVSGAPLLDRILLQHRSDPERGEAETLDSLQPFGETFQVAAVVVAGVGRVEPRDCTRALQTAEVVGLEAVRVAIRQHEVDALGSERALRRQLRERRELRTSRRPGRRRGACIS